MTQSAISRTTKLEFGAAFPIFEVPKIGGGTQKIGGADTGWTLLIVYREVYFG